MVEEGLLLADFQGVIPVSTAMKKNHRISLTLKKDGNKMYGVATAKSIGEKPKFFLPFYVEFCERVRAFENK